MIAGLRAELADLDARSDLVERRIVAQLLEHDDRGRFVASILRTRPYAERGIPRQVRR